MHADKKAHPNVYPRLSAFICGLYLYANAIAAAPPDKLAGRPVKELEGIDVVEHLGDKLPLELMFTDSDGNTAALGDYFRGRPVVLNLGYYKCPMLCGLVLDGLVKSTKRMGWTPGDEYDVVTVSFDPTETPDLAAAKKHGIMTYLDKPGAERGWHFLVGDEHATAALADAAGFGYQWVESQQQYAHAAVIMVVTPDGVLSRYLYYGNSGETGEAFASQTLRLSLVEASDGKVGSTLDHVLLYCYQWDPTSGDYTMVAMNVMRLGGALTAVILGSTIGIFLFREWRRRSIGEPQTCPSGMNTDEHG